jgi:hypothetical protein
MILLAAATAFTADAATGKSARTYDYKHARGYYPCSSDPKGFCRTRRAK